MREANPNTCLYSLCWNLPPSSPPHLQPSAPFPPYSLTIYALLALFILIAALGLWYSRSQGSKRAPGGSKGADVRVLMFGLTNKADNDNDLPSPWLRAQKFPSFRNSAVL